MANGKTQKDPAFETYQTLLGLDLEHKLERWFDGQGGYPLDLNPEYLALMYMNMRKKTQDEDDFSDLSDQDEADNYFARGMPEPFNIDILSLLNIRHLNYTVTQILEHDKLRNQISKHLDSEIPQKFALKNFTLERASEYHPFSFGPTKQPETEKQLLFAENKSDSAAANSDFEVILGTDLLLGSPKRFDSGHCFYLVDVAATHERRQKKQQTTVVRQISGPHSTIFKRALVFGSPKGISVLGYSNMRDPRTVKLLYHSFAKRSCKWASFSMDGIMKESNQRFYLGSIFETKRSNRVYASVLLPSGHNQDSEDKQPESVESDSYHFFCMKYSGRKNTLKLMHHNSLISIGATLDMGHGTVWQQSGRFVFGLIFSCTPAKIWVVVDWKQRFISLGSRSKSHLSCTDWSKRFQSFIPLRGINSFVGVLGVSRPERSAEGHNLYLIGRLQLRL